MKTQIDNFTFHNSDNMEIMKQYPDKYFDLAIVDPPYNASDAIETNKSNSKNKATKRTVYKQFENIAPTDEYWQELKRISKNQIVWGANYFTKELPILKNYIFWYKKQRLFCRLP